MEDSVRFDDLVRTERYFTATLLPIMLFHNNLDGVQQFCTLVDGQAKTEYNKLGKQDPMGTPNYDFDNVEVITEFHIARDLKFAGLQLEPNVGPSEEGEAKLAAPEVLAAPDVVIVAGKELLVCEGKFFNGVNIKDLNEQLDLQRRQVLHLFRNREIRAYRHVAIVPERFNSIDADVVLTWDDILGLAEKLMGSPHYVTDRLREAIKRYKDVAGDSGVRNFEGALPFKEMREKCKMGKEIQVGYVGGETALLKLNLVEAERRQWKWRYPNLTGGRITPGNWLKGARWLEIVESSHGFGSGGRGDLAPEKCPPRLIV